MEFIVIFTMSSSQQPHCSGQYKVPFPGIAMQGGQPLPSQQRLAPMQVTGEEALRAARAASGARVPTQSSSPVTDQNPFAMGGTRLGPPGHPFRYGSAARLDSPAPPSFRQARSRDARRPLSTSFIASGGPSPMQSQDQSDAYTAILTRLDAIESRSRDHAQCMADMMGATATLQS